MLIDKINKKLEKENILFRMESAVYNPKLRTLQLNIEYDNNKMLSSKIKDIVNVVIREEIGENITTQIKYRKNFYDTDIIAEYITELLRQEYPIVNVKLKNIKYSNSDESEVVTILLDESFADFVLTNDLKGFINTSLNANFHSVFEVQINYKKGILKVKEEKVDIPAFFMQNDSLLEVKVESIEPYIGEFIDAPIFPIASYTNPEEGIVVAGKVQNLKENKTKEKVDENGKTKPEKEYYTFELKDYSGAMRVVYFPGKANLQKFKKIADGSEIVLFGNLEEDKFSAGLSFRPKVINLCVLPNGFFERIYSKPVPKNYTNVHPEVYEQTEQSNLFAIEEEIKNPYLLENEFVVFDLETTGTNYQTDKIIEIGAVKVVNGKLTETFSTLVNPCCHIPEDATKVHGITDDDVKDAYTLDKVMPDFFKFCYNSVMVSYVIGFDFNFIDFHSRALGYTFTNKTDDAFVLAKSKLKGLRNYKLTTVAKTLNVTLDNAHRAVYDAVAAAEVMVKLIEKF